MKTKILLTCLLGFVFLSNVSAGPEKEPRASGEGTIRFSIGNLSVPLMMQAADSPMLKKLPTDPKSAHARQRSSFITTDRKLKVQAIEDYVGWGVVEPEEGKWDWKEYRENAKAIKGAGFKYIVFGWVQNLPRWVRNGRTYPRAACVEHHKETEMLSLFSPRTVEAYDRFYGKMRAELGESIDLIRIGSPFDYGEVAYPAGAADWAFPAGHVHEGFWVDEPEARAHFRRAMEVRYATLERLNAAWGTAFASFAKLDYPRDNGSKRYWLDFVNWYYDALTERMGVLVDTVKKHFPKTPLLFSFGWPYEKVITGHDISGLAAMAASKNVEIRIGTGPNVSFLSSKHAATAAHHYKLRGLSSEPANGKAPRESLALVLFKDLTTGMTWHFDYGENLARAPELFQQADTIWRSGAYPQVEAALFLSTSSHRLAAPQKPGGGTNPEKVDDYPGYPDGLSAFAERLRDAVDFDVIDERLVGDEALKSYRVLVWPTGYVAEAATLAKIRQWVQAGGTLLVGDLAQVATVEGERVFGDLRGDATGRTALGRGAVLDGKGRLEFPTTNWRQDLLATRGGYQIDLRVKLQGWLDALRTALGDGADAVLDDPADGVLVSQFADGLIVFNSGTKQVTKLLGAGKAARQAVDLPPLALRWISAK